MEKLLTTLGRCKAVLEYFGEGHSQDKRGRDYYQCYLDGYLTPPVKPRYQAWQRSMVRLGVIQEIADKIGAFEETIDDPEPAGLNEIRLALGVLEAVRPIRMKTEADSKFAHPSKQNGFGGRGSSKMAMGA